MKYNALVVILAAATWLTPGALSANHFAPESDIPNEWTEMNPAELYPDFTYQGLSPSCAASPPTVDRATGEVTFYDSDFTFFVKGGRSDNVLFYFEGGGACWDPMNCLYAHTYKEEVTPLADRLDQAGGIFDLDNPQNPFRNWNIVYIPYCTGDIHWGAADVEYPDFAGAYGGEPQTIRHRGHVNFQVVLKWAQESFFAPKRVFVAGSSAGAYGAILSFPAIREAFWWSKVDVLGDAGNGVSSSAFTQGAAAWNVQLPTWVPGLEDGYTPRLTFGQINRAIADYYRWSNVANFTTAWDAVQTSFFYITNNISTPEKWQSEWPTAWCDWNAGMKDMVSYAAESSNFRYYIAPGTYHTLLTTSDFYDEETLGVPFSRWVRRMVRNYPAFGFHDSRLRNIECQDCADPIPCD